MAQLIVRDQKNQERSFFIRKTMTLIGSSPEHDVPVQATIPNGLVATLVQEAGRTWVLPGTIKVKLNGASLGRKAELHSCDVLEWEGSKAVYLQSVTTALASASAASLGASNESLYESAWRLIQNFHSALGSGEAIQAGLFNLLDGIVEMTGAELGAILAESSLQNEWELVAFRTSNEDPETLSRKILLSDSLLKQTIEGRTPVFIESMIGHPLAKNESVIAARIFSAACLPLILQGRVVGALFLWTRRPGRTIKRKTLEVAEAVATEAALLVSLGRGEQNGSPGERVIRGEGTQGQVSFIYSSETEKMVEIERTIAKIAPTPLPVLIRGETGSGKEVVARSVHQMSPRRNEPFIALNCAAIPGSLIESILFGHEKGAFTGADQAQSGKFVQAHKGTLFLDEIGDLSFDLQAKLLRVLQERKVEPVGAKKPIDVDVRVLSATHQDLEKLVEQGKFRQDLFYRLNGITIRIPPLRERKSDIPILSQMFLGQTGKKLTLSEEALKALVIYSWPGNVRELHQVITRAAFLCDGDEIQVRDLDLVSVGESASGPSPEQELFWKAFEGRLDLKAAQGVFSKALVQRVLNASSGNRTLAASKLGISERTLYRMISLEETS